MIKLKFFSEIYSKSLAIRQQALTSTNEPIAISTNLANSFGPFILPSLIFNITEIIARLIWDDKTKFSSLGNFLEIL